MEDYEKMAEDILSMTGSDEFKNSFMQMLEAEAAAALQNQLDADDWDKVQFQRGYRAALEFVANIREITKVMLEAQKHASL